MLKGLRIKLNNKVFKSDRKVKTSRRSTAKYITAAFWTITAVIVFFSFQSYARTGFLNQKVNNYQAQAEEQMKTIKSIDFISSPAGEDFSEGFARKYMNIPADPKEREARKGQLEELFAEGLKIDQVENLAEFRGKRDLKEIKLYRIKNIEKNTAVYQFRVSYEVVNVTEEIQTIPAKDKKSKPQKKKVLKESKPASYEALLSIPVGTDGISFNVIEQPYFETLPEGSKLAAVKDQPDRTKERDYKKEEEMKEFVNQFFTSYTENTVEEMSYLMKNPGSLKGIYQFKGIEDFTVYSTNGKHVEVKALILLKDSGSGLIVKQPMTLEVLKRDGKFFVENIKNTIGG